MKKYLGVLIVIIVLSFLFFVGRQQDKLTPEQPQVFAECQSNLTKTKDGKIYTCVDGVWVYTGLLNQDKG